MWLTTFCIGAGWYHRRNHVCHLVLIYSEPVILVGNASFFSCSGSLQYSLKPTEAIRPIEKVRPEQGNIYERAFQIDEESKRRFDSVLQVLAGEDLCQKKKDLAFMVTRETRL